MLVLPRGVRHIPGYLSAAAQEALVEDIRAVVKDAPLYTPAMPKTGNPLSVRMTNCGPLGWVTDKERGYRYQATHPLTGTPWPPIPDSLLAIWHAVASWPAEPEACLVNFYDASAKMGQHQDRDEQNLQAPVISVSLGDACLFRVGGTRRDDPTKSFRLESGDIVVLGGEGRLAFHGVDRIYPMTSALLKKGGRINLTLRRVTAHAEMQRACDGVREKLRGPMHARKNQPISFTLALSLVAAPLTPALAASPEPAGAEHGIVVTAQHLASEVGVEVLKGGGNAVDAAVAVGYALAVVYPTAGNLGGGGFMTIRLKDGKTTFLDFRERAPLAATKTMYLDKDGKPVEGASTDTYLAIGVPGSVAGFEAAREKYGTRERAALLAPAIKLAKEGFTLEPGDVESFTGGNDMLAKDDAAAKIFLKDGKPLELGARLVQDDLAKSLAAISEKGPDAFYKGEIADLIVKASDAKGGILKKPDFEGYKVRELKPVTCSYRGYDIVSSPPPSSGGLIICEILNVLEGYPIAYLGYGSAETTRLMVEAMRHAYVDRNTALGDPDFVDNPVEKLTSKAYAEEIRARIDPYKAGVSQALMPEGFGESKETTHYSIVDDEGNAVAVTYTLNGSFGTGKVADGTGILLNNEMDDFTMKPGVPNLYGLVQGEANAIEPGKSPLSSMSPTIVSKEGKPFMVIGSPGGSRIITITLEAIMNVIDHGMNLQEAIDAPRIHHQWLPDKVYMEPYALSPDTRKLLAGMGYSVGIDPDWTIWGEAAGILVGGKNLAEIEAGTGARYYGAIDSRATAGAAVGY